MSSIPVLPAVSAIALRIARWTYFGVRASGASNGRPIHWMRTFSSLSSCDPAEQLAVQAEDVAHLGAGADPVLGREPEHGEPADVAAHGDAHQPGEVLLALGVAVGARQAAPLGPATVAVHDAGDVQRAVGRQRSRRRTRHGRCDAGDSRGRMGGVGSSLAHVMVVGGHPARVGSDVDDDAVAASWPTSSAPSSPTPAARG